MAFGIPSEYFHGGFGLPDPNRGEPVSDVRTNVEDELTQLLVKAGVTWNPRNIARFLINNGVTIS